MNTMPVIVKRNRDWMVSVLESRLLSGQALHLPVRRSYSEGGNLNFDCRFTFGITPEKTGAKTTNELSALLRNLS